MDMASAHDSGHEPQHKAGQMWALAQATSIGNVDEHRRTRERAQAHVFALGNRKGTSCHQCKNTKPLSKLLYCSNLFEKRTKPEKRRCRKKYCETCVGKFYEGNFHELKDSGQWVCASCRGICCCAACERSKLKAMGKLQAKTTGSKVSPPASGAGVRGNRPYMPSPPSRNKRVGVRSAPSPRVRKHHRNTRDEGAAVLAAIEGQQQWLQQRQQAQAQAAQLQQLSAAANFGAGGLLGAGAMGQLGIPSMSTQVPSMSTQQQAMVLRQQYAQQMMGLQNQMAVLVQQQQQNDDSLTPHQRAQLQQLAAGLLQQQANLQLQHSMMLTRLGMSPPTSVTPSLSGPGTPIVNTPPLPDMDAAVAALAAANMDATGMDALTSYEAAGAVAAAAADPSAAAFNPSSRSPAYTLANLRSSDEALNGKSDDNAAKLASTRMAVPLRQPNSAAAAAAGGLSAQYMPLFSPLSRIMGDGSGSMGSLGSLSGAVTPSSPMSPLSPATSLSSRSFQSFNGNGAFTALLSNRLGAVGKLGKNITPQQQLQQRQLAAALSGQMPPAMPPAGSSPASSLESSPAVGTRSASSSGSLNSVNMGSLSVSSGSSPGVGAFTPSFQGMNMSPPFGYSTLGAAGIGEADTQQASQAQIGHMNQQQLQALLLQEQAKVQQMQQLRQMQNMQKQALLFQQQQQQQQTQQESEGQAAMET